MWLIFVGITMPEFVDLGSKIDILWAIRRFFFLVLLDSSGVSDRFNDTLLLPRIYHKIVDMNQYIFPVSLPCGQVLGRTVWCNINGLDGACVYR